MATRIKNDKIWRTKEGKSIAIDKMEDMHLANAIRMLARARGPKLDLKKDKSLAKLVREGQRRGWTIKTFTTPIDNNGRQEWVELVFPTPTSKLSTHMYVPEWDSRLDE